MKETDRLLVQLERLTQLAKQYFKPERLEKVEKLIEYFAERILTAPASHKVHFHSCYPGGWLDHTLNVIDATRVVAGAAKHVGMQLDFSAEEAVFVAMFHDLGKLGDLDESYYITQESDWHRNRGELYKENPAIPSMPHADRSLYILQHFNIEMTQKEWRTIKCHDGLYVEENKPYFRSYRYPPKEFFTNLQHVVHWADMMASLAESDRQRLSKT